MTVTMALFIDGAAGTDMLRLSGHVDDTTPSLLQATHGFGGIAPLLGLHDQQKDHALIIGPGGGRDVLLTLAVGFKQITAIEINPQIVDIVKSYREYNGGLYTDYEQIQVVVAEGRHYLRHSDDKYDLIMMLMPVTKSSRSLNAFALSENYLFTQEAFRDYHRHLTEEGSLLIMAHDMMEVAKLLTTALESLQDEGLGVKDAMTHLYVLGSSMMPLLGLRKTPLSPEERTFLHTAAHDLIFESFLSYIPGIAQHGPRLPLSARIDARVPMMSPLFLALADGQLPLRTLQRETGFNFVPARDDRPFFFHFAFGLPAVVLAVLGLALISLAAVCWLPTVLRRAHSPTHGEPFSGWLFGYFTAIGFGYITIELALLQKLDFFLGDPSRSLALLLAALLIGSGVGSWISRNTHWRKAVAAGLWSAVGAVILLAVLPEMFQVVHNTTWAVQQGIAVVLLLLQGLPMGVLFPLGLQVAQARWGPSVIPWMWAVNGSASVAGSAVAISIAMTLGYTWMHLFGATCYVVAGSAMVRLFQRVR